MTAKPYLYFEPEKIARLRNLNLLARQAVEGFITGLHRSPHKGFSVEFREHREYSPGDDLRHLDWSAWGRSDRYFIKQYEQETNLRAYLLLDVSASMGYQQSGPMSKLSFGCFLTACLGYLMTRQQDAVGLITFDDDVRVHLPPGSTPAHMDRLFKRLEAARPSRRTAMAPVFHRLADTLAKRSLVVILTDLYDDPEAIGRALQHFVHKRHQVMVLHLLDPAEVDFPFRDVTTFVDMETGEKLQIDPRSIGEEYRRDIAEFLEQYRRECSDRNIEYVQATTATPYDRLLLNYLARRKAMR